MTRNIPNECVDFLGEHSGTTRVASRGFEREVTDNRISYCRGVSRIIQRLKDLCTWEVPWIIILISTVQIVVFLVACNDSVALLTFKPRKTHDIWRFVTYHTIHFSLTHLLLNVVLQICIAFPLETEQGHCRILIVYIAGIIFGATGSMFFDSAATVIGGSAGVYSLLFSHISQCFLNWTTISYRNFRLISVSMLFCGDLSFSISKHIFWNDMAPRISYSAHIIGGLSGFLTGMTIFGRLKSRNMSDGDLN